MNLRFHPESRSATFTGLFALAAGMVFQFLLTPILFPGSKSDHGISMFCYVSGFSLLLMAVQRYRFELIPVFVTIGAVVREFLIYITGGGCDDAVLVSILLAGALNVSVALIWFEQHSREALNR